MMGSRAVMCELKGTFGTHFALKVPFGSPSAATTSTWREQK